MAQKTSAISFFAVEEISRFASLISTLSEEDPETGAFVKETQTLLEATKYEDIYEKFSKKTELLLSLEPKEYEKVFNLLIALICQASNNNLSKLVKNVITPISSSPSGDSHQKLRILSNLYNSLEPNSNVRYEVFTAILKVAANNDEIDHIAPQLEDLDQLLTLWGSALKEKRELYLLVSDLLKSSSRHQREAFEFLVKFLQSYDSTDAKTLKSVNTQAVNVIKSAIRIPSVLNFEDVYRLDAVRALGSTPLVDLLKIFLDQTLKDYRAFTKKHAGFVAKEGLSEEENVRKMRVLSLASLASKHIDGEVPYALIAESLELKDDSVEIWVIDGIRAGLLDAKMNQLKKTVVVSRSIHRVFTKDQWAQLGERVDEWRNNLKEVLQVIANAKLIAASQEAPAIVN
ncbi:hypothetical protein HDU97_000408 [Phlyctochytrium planicorne]|nr:hypothetical protein HDU97_000408 [Phlyctochytrium planicorne]